MGLSGAQIGGLGIAAPASAGVSLLAVPAGVAVPVAGAATFTAGAVNVVAGARAVYMAMQNGSGGGSGPRPAAKGGQKLLPANASPTAHIGPSEVAGKTPAQIDARARQLGLQPRGPDPASGRGAYVDPRQASSGSSRIRTPVLRTAM